MSELEIQQWPSENERGYRIPVQRFGTIHPIKVVAIGADIPDADAISLQSIIKCLGVRTQSGLNTILLLTLSDPQGYIPVHEHIAPLSFYVTSHLTICSLTYRHISVLYYH
ncbi:hypothetical protein LENED_006177 [Lentinula edodes]|uniref:Uncharacterized protein n=1 Tax=Lentinula edodes TaxID=5353 RepID=A0A1Q3EB01_LENED|nr:hypothetical protein LENED_006177 [Lentinula edodes]